MKKINFIIALLLTIAVSCQKEDDILTQNDIQPKTVVFKQFLLGNQYVDSARYHQFFDIEIENTHNNRFTDFDFAFGYAYGITGDYKHIIAAPCSKELKAAWSLSEKNYTSQKKTEFYRLPDDFNSYHFDTLSTVSGLKELMEKCSRIYAKDNSTDCFASDEYGWSGGELVAFKTESGKVGVIEIGSITKYKEGDDEGSVWIEIKFEGK